MERKTLQWQLSFTVMKTDILVNLGELQNGIRKDK